MSVKKLKSTTDSVLDTLLNNECNSRNDIFKEMVPIRPDKILHLTKIIRNVFSNYLHSLDVSK